MLLRCCREDGAAFPFFWICADAPSRGSNTVSNETHEDEIIVRQGETGHSFYVVEKGEFDLILTRTRKNGSTKDIIVDKIGPGSSFGDLSLLYGTPRSVTIRARTPGKLLVLPRTEFLRVLGRGGSDVIQAHFRKHATVERGGEAYMKPEEFIQLLKDSTPDDAVVSPNDPGVQQVLTALLDRSKTGLISFPDLIAFDQLFNRCVLLLPLYPEQEAKILFRLADADSDGFLSATDLATVPGLNLSDAQLDTFFGPERRRFISFVEFRHLLAGDNVIDLSKEIPGYTPRPVPPEVWGQIRTSVKDAWSKDVTNLSHLWERSTFMTPSFEEFEYISPKDKSKSLLAGGFAGAVSRTATAPLERLKVMKQVYGRSATFMGMLREEGVRAMWKGNGTNVARIAPYSAIQFFAFDMYKRKICADGEVTAFRRLMAGALAGMTSSFICYPLDLVRSKLTVQTEANPKYRGIVQTLTTVVKEDGFFGLYRGLPMTLVGIAPYVAINYATFDSLKRFVPPRDSPYFTAVNLTMGAVAGGVAATITYPTDLLRRRMQLSGTAGLPVYNSSMDVVKHIWKADGFRGFYSGLVACYAKWDCHLPSTKGYEASWSLTLENSYPLTCANEVLFQSWDVFNDF